jgi:hypothetical protein
MAFLLFHSAAGPFGASHYITKAAEGNAQLVINNNNKLQIRDE